MSVSIMSSEDEVRERLVPVILGADILGYSYVRCFHETYGVSSIVLASADVKVTSSSRFCDYRVLDGLDADSDAALLAHLDAVADELDAKGKVGILLACGDWYTRILSARKELLSQRFFVPCVDFALLDDITQKERFYSICEELGMPYPRTWRYDCADPAATIDVSEFSFPVIAKPSNSARYHYAEFPGKKKIFEVATPEELTEIFENLKGSSYDRELIVQDFIPGEDDGLRSITIYVDSTGTPVMTCMGRVVLQDHDPTAIGNPVCIMSERVEGAIEDACRFLAHVGYRGFANFDVKYDPRDGKYKFFEVNTRPGRNTFYVNLAGSNFVKLIVDDFVLGRAGEKHDATMPFLYACVPPYVVRRTVRDAGLRARVLEMYRNGRAGCPLFYGADSVAHAFWAALTYYHQIAKFKRYVWDVEGVHA